MGQNIASESGHETGPIRVAVMAAASPFGQEMFRSLSQWEAIEMVLAVDHKEVGKTMRALAGGRAPNIKVEDKLGAALDRERCDVLVDFSHSSAALQHGISALKRGVSPILNANLSSPEIRELVSESRMTGTPALVAPHLSVLEVMLLEFCRNAARWIPDFEVVDVQPEHKLADLGPFAKSAAEAIASGWEKRNLLASGGIDYGKTKTWEDVRSHCLLLRGSPGYQEIHFGSPGETLSMRFQSFDPAAIVDGLKLAISTVRDQKGVVVGLEKLLSPKGGK